MTIRTNLPGARGAKLVALLTVAPGLALVGCSSSSHSEAAPTPGGAAASAAVSTAAPGASMGPAATAKPPKQKLPKGAATAKPKDPLAPKKIRQVKRAGKAPHPTAKVKGGVKKFSQDAIYTDGLKLTITKMTQGKMTGQGPGVYPGRPVTDFYLKLTNGTKQSLELGVVVLTVTYGSPARLAHAVYTPTSHDFAGVVKAGASTRAVYGFSVPAADRGDVTMTVDIDGQHHVATFAGTVK